MYSVNCGWTMRNQFETESVELIIDTSNIQLEDTQ